VSSHPVDDRRTPPRRGPAQQLASGEPPRWRVGIAGIAIEASTFSPHRSDLAAFTCVRGKELLARYPWIDASSPVGCANGARTWCQGVEWVPLLHARALPGGPVLPETYRALADEILARCLSDGPFDAMLLDIHGAMSVVGMRDAEADLAAGVRSSIGPDPLLGATMDLHGNMSLDLARLCDLVTCYRMAPHEDAAETKERAARNLVRRLRHGGRPLKAWAQIPVLLPGERTSTRLEPARGIYGRIPDIEARPGILDAALFVGYAWGDEPRSRAAVVVTGDDAPAVTAAASELATAYWDARHDFSFVAPTADFATCLAEALASDRRPFVISDSGDNPTAGGAGDVTYGLAQLLASEEILSGKVTACDAAIYDPEATRIAEAGGLGSTVSLVLGGHLDTVSPPVAMRGEVTGIARSEDGTAQVVAIRTGGLTVLVTAQRKQFDLVSSWIAAGVDPRDADIVVVKLGYLEPEIYALAADWRLALTPGGVDQDLVRLGHQHLERPVYPFDPDMANPHLAAELL
jgi:microcystin degradation protein MlrC